MDELKVKHIPIKKVYQKITKKDIIEHVCKQLLDYGEIIKERNKFYEYCKIDKRYKYKNFNKKDIIIIIDMVFSTISEALKNENIIELRGIGVFKPKIIKTKIQDHKLNGRKCKSKTPPRKSVSYKIAKNVKEELNRNSRKIIYLDEDGKEIINEGEKQ